ncbi:translocation/assembly module TamB domain-containing protein [Sphingomonas immobilis]|uniref:Translocation/assembly module TamB domain-containing protein n=1 Tax=Sphingomonas immobilis TaxID=3063997 RepID=A0ABT9A0K1_9SPHN|nr:translocation/assembly module TamB domain-containing protein [Sphingomonas sp. CA1-15]MDO7843357.1 translocation/assembly module TamB domain-containing protein [Sphingomonas sp. CA1-15]
MSEDAAPAPKRTGGWARRILTLVALLLALVTLGVVTLDSDIGHRWVADRIAALRPANGLRYSVGRIDGSLFSKAVIVDLRISDPQGLVLAVPRADLDWSPLAWLGNRLDIESLVAPQASLVRVPTLVPSARKGPILPGFDIRIGALRIDRLTVARRITGTARRGRVAVKADIRGGRARIDLDALIAGSDTVKLKLDAEPDHDRFDLDLTARGTARGLLAHTIGVPQPVAVDIHGDGTWRKWRGKALADIGTTRLADLALGNDAGAYTLAGTLTPSPIARGKLQRLTAPHVRVDGRARLADRRLTGTLNLRSAAMAVESEGVIDLASSAFESVRLRARLLQPPALFPNMTGRNIELRAILDGAFGSAAFDYRLTADRFAFDQTGFEGVRAAGKGHFSKAPVLLPVRLSAQRVTGVGDVAGGILRNLTLEGLLRVTPKLVTGDDLRLSSDKLKGRFTLILDLTNGHYEVGINGGLARYLIPGLGVVDVTSNLKVVPGAGGQGTRVIGQGTATMVRLDNAFFRSLTGGLPKITTGLERTPDGILHLTNLVLTSPQLRLAGNGIRRRDGTFHFEGSGKQATYGPLTLKLDGKIDRPTLDLVFASPNAALGLSAVTAHLDPTATGFAFTAKGGSRLGPFGGEGAILLPKGGGATIAIARLDVSGTQAKGDLAVVPGGFDGRLALAGGGISGELLFKPAGEHQRIEAHLDAAAAKLANAVTLRRGHLDAVLLLDPEGTSIEATATGNGLRRGALVIGRFAAHAALKGGSGEVRLAVSGQRGRAFDIQSVIAVTPDRYSLTAQGTLDRKPLQFVTPAVFTRDGDGWRLAPAKLRFSGGEADLSGRFTGSSSAIDATLSKLPLAILDIGYPGLGLGGNASGTLSYSQSAGAAPTGKIDMTVRGLTRSGLVLSSRPVDVGIAAILSPDKVAARAVAASGGKTVGRAQMQLTLPGGSDLAARVANAPMFAQLRYDGPADTLWRLTGIELFDLSGPVAIGADVGGRLADPQIRGVVQANGAKIESATTGTVLTNVMASGRFNGSRLVLDKIAADAGKGGRVTGAGSFDLAAANGFGIDLSVQAQNALLINRDDIAATVTGPLSFKSDGAGGVIAGDVTLTKSSYRLGQASAATAVPRLNLREINLPGGGEEDDAPRKPWRLAVHAKAPNNLTVTGLGLRSEWSADLTIGGAPDNPAISGRADLVQGDYVFAGRSFELERGKILFSGEVPANPSLDIAANADASGLSATIRVTGPALKPEISFASVPALPQDELLSRLLFGTSITSLSAPEALQLAAAVAALQDGKGGLDPINAVRRVTGLDRLRVLPADPQTGAGTSVAAGKYITRRLFAEIITDGQGYSATQAEFRVTRWLSILSSVSTIGRQSANVRVSKDY